MLEAALDASTIEGRASQGAGAVQVQTRAQDAEGKDKGIGRSSECGGATGMRLVA
jgi:hypothetical protein